VRFYGAENYCMATNETRIVGFIEIENQIAAATCPRTSQIGLVQDLLTILLGLPADEVQPSGISQRRALACQPTTMVRADLDQLCAELKQEAAAVM
jgi:hypothetical protein